MHAHEDIDACAEAENSDQVFVPAPIYSHIRIRIHSDAQRHRKGKPTWAKKEDLMMSCNIRRVSERGREEEELKQKSENRSTTTHG